MKTPFYEKLMHFLIRIHGGECQHDLYAIKTDKYSLGNECFAHPQIILVQSIEAFHESDP